ncbi:Polyphosphate:nucleotide phosphotransferase, PPK2 family protein [Lacticaseibacillus paracasei subsp. paracasei Lpp228]|nr:Polyphosphate:nucleotide phosphotransferase, PPK2 family protein [Lacticaseibacillus paracasei subsp. paracasei Lpp228]
MQQHLAAQKQYSVLIIFQGMDAAGKDSMIEHVMSGVNPQGTSVVSFKVPTELELDHDFLWRIHKAFPAGGELTVFNRSQYEEVLVDRVHPELLLKENLPGIDSVQDVSDSLWAERFNDIKALEAYARRNGILILKFFLHLSKAEQKIDSLSVSRFRKRIGSFHWLILRNAATGMIIKKPIKRLFRTRQPRPILGSSFHLTINGIHG